MSNRRISRPRRNGKLGRRRRPEEQNVTPAAVIAGGETGRLGPRYEAGPALSLTPPEQEKVSVGPALDEAETAAGPEAAPGIAPVATVQGAGPARHAEAHANSIRLTGRTDADFDGGSFRTVRTRLSRATGCEGCGGDDCVRARGTLVTRYSVTTTVTLPSLADFPDLTRCQRDRVRNAIRNVLAPHEQRHVRAFRTYNGVTSRPFDLTLCRGDFDSQIRAMMEAEEGPRRDAAQALSDALDPFHFDVDLDCEDPPARRRRRADAGPLEQEEVAV